MTNSLAGSPLPILAAELRQLKSSWGWFFALGILLVVLGGIAIGAAAFMTRAWMLLFGWLLIIGGVAEAAQAFAQSRWRGFFVDMLTGLLYLVVGFLVVANPRATAVALTLLIAMFLMVDGIFRIAGAIAARPPHWGWLVAHGVISVLLGISIWQGWPFSGLWIIGLFIGIHMLLNGWTLVMLSWAIKNAPVGPEPAG